MKSKYFTVEVKPIITLQPTDFAANDVLFDWTRFEIPVGTAKLVSVVATVPGTDGTAANEIDKDIFFAKSIDGEAPPSLGTSNSAISNDKAIAARPYMIAGGYFDASELGSIGGAFTSFNLYSGQLLCGGASAANSMAPAILLEGERAEKTTYTSGGETVRGTTGYQTIYMAAGCRDAFNFGTGMLVDHPSGGGGVYASGTTSINLDGTAGDILVAPGDRLIAINDGAVMGEVEAVSDDGSHTTLTIKSPGLTQAVQDGDEIGLQNPITYRLGFEY